MTRVRGMTRVRARLGLRLRLQLVLLCSTHAAHFGLPRNPFFKQVIFKIK